MYIYISADPSHLQGERVREKVVLRRLVVVVGVLVLVLAVVVVVVVLVVVVVVVVAVVVLVLVLALVVVAPLLFLVADVCCSCCCWSFSSCCSFGFGFRFGLWLLLLFFLLLLLLLLLFSSSLSNPATSKADLLIPRNAPAPRVSVPPKAKAPESTCRSASDIAGSEEKYTHTFPTQEQVTTKPFFLRSRPLDQGSAAGGVAPLISFIWLFGLEVCTLHSMCAHGFSTHSIFISQLKCEWHPERPAIRAQVAALLWLRGVKAGPIWWLGNDGPTPSLGAIAEGLTRRPSGPVAVPVGRHWSPITKWYGFAMFHFRYEPWSVLRRLGQNHRN